MNDDALLRGRMIDAALSARIPGGSLARDWFAPHEHPKAKQNVRDVVGAMLDAALTAPASCREGRAVEPAAWLHIKHPTAYVITDRVKCIWLKCKEQHVERYTIPLYAAPPNAAPPDGEFTQTGPVTAATRKGGQAGAAPDKEKP